MRVWGGGDRDVGGHDRNGDMTQDVTRYDIEQNKEWVGARVGVRVGAQGTGHREHGTGDRARGTGYRAGGTVHRAEGTGYRVGPRAGVRVGARARVRVGPR